MHYGYGYFEEERLGQIGDVGLWRRILSYVKPYWKAVLAAILLALLISAAALSLPYLVRIGIDAYIVNADPTMEERLRGLAHLALIFAALMLLEFTTNFLQVMLLERTGQQVMHEIRQDLFGHVLDLDLAFFNRNPVGKLVTRLTNDVQNMHEMFTSVIVTLFNDAAKIIAILAIMFWMHWELTLILSLLLPVMVLNAVVFSRYAREAFRAIRTQLARINAFLEEVLSGITILQIFSRERDTETRFRQLNQNYLDATLHQIRVFGVFVPLIEVLSSTATAVIIWYGGREILHGRMTLGILVAFLSYMRLFFQPLRELSAKYSIIQSAMASAERIFQLLETQSTVLPPKTPMTLPDLRGAITFRDVTFGYKPSQPVVDRLNFQVAPGETLAVVGATGAGKTTLINLLERFYDPDAGEISIDGADLKKLNPAWLRRQIGLVMQDIFIVPGTLKENILLDRSLTNDALNRIIHEAQLTGLVNRLPQGLETRIGEGGIDLSAGEKQLLAFARVLARNPRILVLDEATSNVDSETEMLIEKAIASTLAGRTSIVIAHRLSTIRRADRILVMNRGRIVEEGTHTALMAQQGLYHHLQSLQFRTAELEPGAAAREP
jgi:ATP-binding cassette subfamily B protein